MEVCAIFFLVFPLGSPEPHFANSGFVSAFRDVAENQAITLSFVFLAIGTVGQRSVPLEWFPCMLPVPQEILVIFRAFPYRLQFA